MLYFTLDKHGDLVITRKTGDMVGYWYPEGVEITNEFITLSPKELRELADSYNK